MTQAQVVAVLCWYYLVLALEKKIIIFYRREQSIYAYAGPTERDGFRWSKMNDVNDAKL